MNINGEKKYWAVMRAYPWRVLKVYGSHPAKPMNPGLSAFIPLFESYETALGFAGEDAKHDIFVVSVSHTEEITNHGTT